MEQENPEIDRIELSSLTRGETGPRLVDGAARIVPRGWLKHRTSIRGRMILVYPGRVWIKGNIRTRYPWPGDLVCVWCTPAPAGRPPSPQARWQTAPLSMRTPDRLAPWPECSAQGRVVSVLLNRRETIIELEVFPGQEGWMRLLRLYVQLRNTPGHPLAG